MATKIKIAAALVAGTVAVPAVAYWVQLPASDLLADKLRSYGFYPSITRLPLSWTSDRSITSVKTGDNTRRFVSPSQPTSQALSSSPRACKSRKISVRAAVSRPKMSVSFRSFIKGSAANNYVEEGSIPAD